MTGLMASLTTNSMADLMGVSPSVQDISYAPAARVAGTKRSKQNGCGLLRMVILLGWIKNKNNNKHFIK